LGQPAAGAAGLGVPAKTTLFAGGNEADVRKMAVAPSPQAIFPID
jgi:hypothetical protein